ncbi:hypothetical protein D6D04_09407 [Aureobasidium pullulans]|nr:hypothetical protein D6D04_09407 [Aureobasidium pullulans]
MEPLIRDIIIAEAQRLRFGDGSVTLEHSSLSEQGRSHYIFVVTLADDSKIVARVARTQGTEKLERRAINTLKHIKASNTDCQVPRIHWHNLDQPREIPPVILEDLIQGRSLNIWNSAIPKELQHAFLDSLAQFLLDLWYVEAPESASASSTVRTYSNWLENEIDKAIRRCITGSGKWGNVSDYLVMRSMIPQIAHHLDDFQTIGIAHGDMNAHNFIVNERLELMGYVNTIYPRYPAYLRYSVVDWDWTFEAPLPAVIQYPWFIADVPGWHNDGVELGETFEHNRDYLVKMLKVKEEATRKIDTVSTLLAQASERQRFQSAISYRDIHREYVVSDLVFLEAKSQDIRPQLEAFLMKHPELTESSTVKQIVCANQIDSP